MTHRNLVTASGIAPVEFAREIFSLLDLYEPAVLASWYKLYGQHDAARYFELPHLYPTSAAVGIHWYPIPTL